MSIHRSASKGRFTMVANQVICDRTLSLKAKGLLALMLSLPDDWEFNMNNLCCMSGEGMKSVRNAIRELESRGFVVRTMLTPRESGTGGFLYRYDVYDTPQQHHPDVYAPEVHAQKRPQYNTISTKTQGTKTNNQYAEEDDVRAREASVPEDAAKSADVARCVSVYRQEVGEIPNGRAFELLCSYVDDVGAEAVIEAVHELGLSQPVQPFRWLCAVLNSFAESGVRSRDGALAHINEHRRRSRGASSPAPQPAIPDYSDCLPF